jgi:hypothetical protein
MLIADVFKALLIDNSTKEQFATATLSTAGFEITSETKDVEGGGVVVATLHSPRKETITLQDVRFHFDILAKQLGTTIAIGAGEAWTFPKLQVVEAVKKVTLAKAPKTPADVKVKDSTGTLLVYTTDYTVAGSEITIVKSGINIGDTVEVQGYKYATSATTQTITIDNTKYPGGFTCVLETLEIGEDELPKNTIQIVFDSTVFDGSVKFDTQTSRDAIKHDINLKVLNAVGYNIAGRIVRIPVA